MFDYGYREIAAIVGKSEDNVRQSPPAPELTGDGGGKVPALARSLRGRSRVARAIVSWVGRVARLPGVSLRLAEINGGPGALLLDGQQRLIGVCALDTSGAQITSISGIVTLTS